MTNNELTLGEYIKELRKNKEKTLHNLATATDIDSTMLSKIERGDRLPTLEQIKRIANFFEVSENDLIAKLTAEKIVKDYGINSTTLSAIQIVAEKIETYKKKND